MFKGRTRGRSPSPAAPIGVPRRGKRQKGQAGNSNNSSRRNNEGPTTPAGSVGQADSDVYVSESEAEDTSSSDEDSDVLEGEEDLPSGVKQGRAAADKASNGKGRKNQQGASLKYNSSGIIYCFECNLPWLPRLSLHRITRLLLIDLHCECFFCSAGLST